MVIGRIRYDRLTEKEYNYLNTLAAYIRKAFWDGREYEMALQKWYGALEMLAASDKIEPADMEDIHKSLLGVVE